MASFPLSFSERIRKQFPEASEHLLQSIQQPAPVSIRINPFKVKKDLPLEKIAWAEQGYYLPQRPLFAADPWWHGGAYYVQEASSMFLVKIMKQLFGNHETIRVLDLCASPGGKSTQILSLLSQNSLLVANEVIAPRNKILRENMVRWGNANIIVTQNDPSDFQRLPGFFDAIIVDAPCSGEGLFRKDPDAMQQWSDANCELCASRQKRILADVYPALKQGGYIIYSTCTFNPEENEKQIAYMQHEFSMTSIPLRHHAEWNIHEDEFNGLHFYPHRTKGEGFFIAALKKTSEEKQIIKIPANRFLKSLASKERNLFDHLIHDAENHDWLLFNDTLHIFPAAQIDALKICASALHIQMFGSAAVQQKNNDIIPQPSFAFSNLLQPDAYDSWQLNHEEAIQLLRKEPLDFTGEKGWLLAKYEHIALAFLKSTGNRINNYYPSEWRLRKEVSKDEFWSLESRCR